MINVRTVSIITHSFFLLLSTLRNANHKLKIQSLNRIVLSFYRSSIVSFSDGNTKMGGAHLTEEGKLKLDKLIFSNKINLR